MKNDDEPQEIEIATLGGGCFWCTEAVFQELEGVERVESGYTGGDPPNPTYQEICTGTTGHAEAVQVHFDASVISYRDILEVFFLTHDPTTLDQQGGDIGTQYRSAIFYQSPRQREVAEEFIAKLEGNGVFDAPIVTEVARLELKFPAGFEVPGGKPLVISLESDHPEHRLLTIPVVTPNSRGPAVGAGPSTKKEQGKSD